MKTTMLSAALVMLGAPLLASGAPSGDLVNRPPVCAPGEVPVALGEESCTPGAPLGDIAVPGAADRPA